MASPNSETGPTSSATQGIGMDGFIEQDGIILFVVSSDGSITMHNKVFEETTGYYASELTNKHISEFCADTENEARCRQLIRETLSSEQKVDFELAIKTKKSDRLDLFVNCTKSSQSDGLVSSVVCFAEQAKKRNQLLRYAAKDAAQDHIQLLNLSEQPIFGVDCSGLVDIWNDRLATITSISAEVRLTC